MVFFFTLALKKKKKNQLKIYFWLFVFLLPDRFAPLLSLQRMHQTLVMSQVTWKGPQLVL